MKLIVGLGNWGPEYQNTRHNIGFIALEHLAAKLGLDFNKSKFFASVAEGRALGERLILLRPQTFMNLSGKAVAAAADFYKIEHQDILIIHDDMDLPCGMLRLRAQGSAGGHNGIKDIIAKLGNDTRLARCKIGISHPVYGDTVNYVLGSFSPDEQELLRPAVEEAAAAACCWITEGISVAMNRYNGKAHLNRKD